MCVPRKVCAQGFKKMCSVLPLSSECRIFVWIFKVPMMACMQLIKKQMLFFCTIVYYTLINFIKKDVYILCSDRIKKSLFSFEMVSAFFVPLPACSSIHSCCSNWLTITAFHTKNIWMSNTTILTISMEMKFPQLSIHITTNTRFSWWHSWYISSLQTEH